MGWQGDQQSTVQQVPLLQAQLQEAKMRLDTAEHTKRVLTGQVGPLAEMEPCWNPWSSPARRRALRP